MIPTCDWANSTPAVPMRLDPLSYLVAGTVSQALLSPVSILPHLLLKAIFVTSCKQIPFMTRPTVGSYPFGHPLPGVFPVVWPRGRPAGRHARDRSPTEEASGSATPPVPAPPPARPQAPRLFDLGRPWPSSTRAASTYLLASNSCCNQVLDEE